MSPALLRSRLPRYYGHRNPIWRLFRLSAGETTLIIKRPVRRIRALDELRAMTFLSIVHGSGRQKPLTENFRDSGMGSCGIGFEPMHARMEAGIGGSDLIRAPSGPYWDTGMKKKAPAAMAGAF